MFRNSKLLFWTCEILVMDGDFLYLEINGDFNFSICLCSEYHPLTIFNYRFLYYITNPIVELLEKHLKSSVCLGFLITLVLLFGIIGLGIFICSQS